MSQATNLNLNKHLQLFYAQNPRLFARYRLRYYQSERSTNQQAVERLFLNDKKNGYINRRINIEKILERLIKVNPDVIIVTATSDRPDSLERLFDTICNQHFPYQIAWIIIDNSTESSTIQKIKVWQKSELWISTIQYREPFGYASPARNRGLALIQWLLKYRWKKSHYWVVDSDDLIADNFSLLELYKHSNKKNSMMIHGFSKCVYYNQYGLIVTQNTIPRNLNSSFPNVRSLKDELDAGPSILAAIMGCQNIPYNYYPDEFTMEDDALNQRIYLRANAKKLKITGIDYPCLTKVFHKDSMSGKNENIGNQNIQVQLGPTAVKGVRAQVVVGLRELRDYYTRENL